jgi:hypothetical protein
VAYIIPSDISAAALAGAHSSELQTLAGLKSALSSDYTVYHGVHWTRDYRGQVHFGEADFVVVNRSGQMLVIEQKNGRLEDTPDGLFKVYGDTRKDVQSQVRRSMENIREKMREVTGAPPPSIDYLIYCPDHRLVQLNAVGLDASRIVSGAGPADLAARIRKILPTGTAGSAADAVHAFLRDAFQVVADVHAHVTAHERSYTRLVGGIADIVGSIEMEPLRLRLNGAPGSGKTVVAHRLFERALSRGRKPLMVCFNRPLAERLAASVSPGGLVTTWHGLCISFLADRGFTPDFGEAETNRNFWRDIADLIIAEAIPDAWQFDTLIVDEGQDFELGWIDILRLFLTETADIVWLEDPDQDLRGLGRKELPGFVSLSVRTNYRSPQSIARFVKRALGADFIAANDLPGLGVGISTYGEEGGQAVLLARIVPNLVRQGFAADQIAVISLKGASNSTLSGLKRIAAYDVSHFTGTYTENGQQVRTPGPIHFDSVQRFKGQQAAAVIVCDVDPAEDPDRKARHLRQLFSACTRATVRLEILAQRDNPFTALLVGSL